MHFKKAFYFILGSFLLLKATAYLIPLPDTLQRDYSAVVYSREGSVLRSYLTSDQKWRYFSDSKKLPKHIVDGLTCLEDQRFFWHPGVDPLALSRASFQYLKEGRIISGASTLSMQLARMMEPKARTVKSKLLEILRALQYELRFSKKEILDLYLSHVPFGSNIEGLEAASHFYFQKNAKELSKGEYLFLLLLPQNPHRWDDLKREELVALRNEKLDRWQNCGLVTNPEYQDIKNESIPRKRVNNKVLAPHMSDYYIQNQDKKEIYSTLDYSLQDSLEQFVLHKKNHYSRHGVRNSGVIVIELATRSVVAATGNFDYFSKNNAQMMNSLNVPRSPGSTLKPFLMSLAVSEGKVLPETLLKDYPVKIGAYSPENFDGQYSGLVRADEALFHSLNVPFVLMLKDYGFQKFLQNLQSVLPEHHFSDQPIGLSLIVGGVEMTPLELAQVYLTLALHGQNSPLKTLQDVKDNENNSHLITASAVQMVENILKRRHRPDFDLNENYFPDNNIVWKTGTSQKKKDAWSVGYNDKHLVLVWLGNLDRESSSLLTGAQSAAPLMFDVFKMLPQNTPTLKLSSKQNELTETTVCAFSGMRATESCPHKKKVFAIKGQVPTEACPYHKKVMVDNLSGMRVNQGCLSSNGYQWKNILYLPTEINQHYKRSYGYGTQEIALAPQCQNYSSIKNKIAIESPQALDYVNFNKEKESILRLPLRISKNNDQEDHLCLLDGQALASAKSFIEVSQGRHYLFCSNASGQSDEITFSVR